MNWSEIKYSLNNLGYRKMRSFLTVLSILIGVTAIYAIVSFGLGIANYVEVVAQEAGTDKLFVQAEGVGAPGTDDTFSLTQDELDFIGKIKGVRISTGMYMAPAEIKQDKERRYYFINGIDMDEIDFVLEAFTIDILEGRQVKEGETTKMVLGYNYQFPNKVFKKPVKIGDKLDINEVPMEVVGFYEEVGNPTDDAAIYITHEAFEKFFPEKKGLFGWGMIGADRNEDPEELAIKITDKLRKYKDQEEGKETFFVQTFSDAIATFSTIINVLNSILFLIALVSVIVASVNIMNTMYTAVLERTQEIGIMKAIGARNSDILLIFIFEAGFLGAVGGTIGVFLGWLIASSAGAAAKASGFALLQPIFPLVLTVSCIFFSFLVGAAAGVLPARQASKLKPVQALRYE